MPELTLNPGFVLILAALIVLATPQPVRVPTMALSSVLALVLLLFREFGAAAAEAQIGIPVVLLDLDASLKPPPLNNDDPFGDLL